MTTIIAGATREECPICFEEYEKNEQDVDKRIQLACGHFFHRECYRAEVSFQKSRAASVGKHNVDINCCYCSGINIPKTKNSNPYSSEASFKRELDVVVEEYEYDDEVQEILPYLYKLRDTLLNKYKQKSASSKSKILVSVEKTKNHLNTVIGEELKPIVLAILQDEIFSRMFEPDFFRQDYFFVGNGSFNITDRQQFNLWVQQVKQNYNDDTATSISSILDTLYPSLCELFAVATRDSQQLQADLVVAPASILTNGKIIPERLHLIALRVLKAMFTGDLALRTIEEQVQRWRGKDLPDKIQKNGILVTYPPELAGPTELAGPVRGYLQVRISCEQLEREIASVIALEKKEIASIIAIEKQKARLRESITSFLLGCTLLTVGSIAFNALNNK